MHTVSRENQRTSSRVSLLELVRYILPRQAEVEEEIEKTVTKALLSRVKYFVYYPFLAGNSNHRNIFDKLRQ